MPKQVGSGSNAATGVQASSIDKPSLTVKSNGNKVAQAAQRLSQQIKQTMAKFSTLENGQAKAQQPGVAESGSREAGPLDAVLRHLDKTDNTMVLRKVDSEFPVTKQLNALRGMSSVDRLKAITFKLPWSEKGNVNLSFIEHFCGLRNAAKIVTPGFELSTSEGQTLLPAQQRDFMFGVVANEISLIDSILCDIEQKGVEYGIKQETYSAMMKVSDTLKKSANLMSTISRHELLNVQMNNPYAVSEAAHGYIQAVKQLPPGERLLVPLGFASLGTGEPKSAGHATYLVVEKNWNNSVNLHMVNRGAGSSTHRTKPGEFAARGQHPKTESAVSKWSVPIDATGGFSHNFLVKTLMLMLDAQVAPGGRGIVPTYHADPSRQMYKNIAKFYVELGLRTGSAPPHGYQPIYQRPQKDGNCTYSNLKASIRYLLGDSKMYNEIDILKTEKVAQLTLNYMRENLLQNPDLATVNLNRVQFNAEGAVEKLIVKHEKAMHRVKLDTGAALPLNLPSHLRNVTN